MFFSKPTPQDKPNKKLKYELYDWVMTKIGIKALITGARERADDNFDYQLIYINKVGDMKEFKSDEDFIEKKL